jgi:hypothetical protein
MGVSVRRLPQEVLLEEFYRGECSKTVQVGRVRVFEEFLTVFNCSVLTFWSAIKFHREQNCYSIIEDLQLPSTLHSKHDLSQLSTVQETERYISE